MTNPNPSPELLPMSEAPKDGSYIVGYYRSIDNERTEHWDGRAFVIRHEGKTASDYDLGWALFPGYGGVPDICFAGWAPLPAALSQTPPTPSLSTDVQSAATGFHEHDVSLKVAMPAPGEAPWTPDRFTLTERELDDECGCPEETWDTPFGVLNMHLSAGKPSNACLDNGDEGEWHLDLTAATIDDARSAFFAWSMFAATLTPTLATVAAGDDEGFARGIEAAALLALEHAAPAGCERFDYDEACHDIAAAILLLSQGGGKV
jgi:hypothetical protein